MIQKAIALRFSSVIEKLRGVPIPRCAGEFRLLSRRALTELDRMRESHWFLRGLALWIGFRQTQITYHHDGWVTGRTHYSRH
jgi:polyisoprenyl-phosphate glycosyltransferase